MENRGESDERAKILGCWFGFSWTINWHYYCIASIYILLCVFDGVVSMFRWTIVDVFLR
jgi:hypothetical protein